MSTDRRAFLEIAAADGALAHARLDMFMGTVDQLIRDFGADESPLEGKTFAVVDSRGGAVIALVMPNDPSQFIDARDLADLMIRLVEQKALGTFNGVSPTKPTTMTEVLYDSRTHGVEARD